MLTDFDHANVIAHDILYENAKTEHGLIDHSRVFDMIRGKTEDEVFWLILRSRAFGADKLYTLHGSARVPALRVTIELGGDFNSNTARLAAGMLVDYCKAYDNMKGV